MPAWCGGVWVRGGVVVVVAGGILVVAVGGLSWMRQRGCSCAGMPASRGWCWCWCRRPWPGAGMPARGRLGSCGKPLSSLVRSGEAGLRRWRGVDRKDNEGDGAREGGEEGDWRVGWPKVGYRRAVRQFTSWIPVPPRWARELQAPEIVCDCAPGAAGVVYDKGWGYTWSEAITSPMCDALIRMST